MPTQTISPCIGNTPLIKIKDGLYAKLETLNPSGSIKDRMACYILDHAEKNGLIQPGGTIVEATSGNTGIAFSMLAAERGYKMIVVMPNNMSQERKQMIRSFGAEIVDVGPGDFTGAVVKRDELVKELNAFCPRQFSNPVNTECHRETTGREIIDQIDELEPKGGIAAIVAGTGTGGTLMGVGELLKEHTPQTQIVGVEPMESNVMERERAGTMEGYKPQAHPIQGIGDGFIPPIVDMQKVDDVVAVSAQDSIERMRQLSREMGLLVGVSSGANVLAAEKWMKENQPTGVVVTILPDRQERYLSMLG